MTKLEPNIVREGTIYSPEYIREHKLEDDFCMLTIDVAKVLGVRRENVQTYVLPQLDYVKADIALKRAFNNVKVKNLISKKSVNDYISKAFKITNKKIALSVPKDNNHIILKELSDKYDKRKIQRLLSAAIIDLNCKTEQLNIKTIIKLPDNFKNINFVDDIELWSSKKLLDGVFNYYNQIMRMLEHTSHIEGQLALTVSSTKDNDKGIRYIFPNKETDIDLFLRVNQRQRIYFSISHKTFHYINSIINERFDIIKYNDTRDTDRINKIFIDTLLEELLPFIEINANDI